MSISAEHVLIYTCDQCGTVKRETYLTPQAITVSSRYPPGGWETRIHGDRRVHFCRVACTTDYFVAREGEHDAQD